MGRRLALLIATYEYQDSGLRQLTAPAHDAEALAEVLRDPEIAGFEVTTLINEPHHRVGEAIGELYRDRRRDDLTLLYFTGHGLKDDAGRLYLAMTDTRRDGLMFSGVAAEQIDQAMDAGCSHQQVLVLDCCYSGSYPAGRRAKADDAVHTLSHFRGRGRTVLTSSDSTQYSFEGDRLEGEAAQSVFTRYFVAGIRDGSADADGDGEIALDELYTYVHDNVVRDMPQQRPKKMDDVSGRIFIARNIHWALPAHLRSSIESPFVDYRQAALRELEGLHRRGGERVRGIVAEQIRGLLLDDSKSVSLSALKVLQSVLPSPDDPGLAEVDPPEGERAARERAERALAGERDAWRHAERILTDRVTHFQRALEVEQAVRQRVERELAAMRLRVDDRRYFLDAQHLGGLGEVLVRDSWGDLRSLPQLFLSGASNRLALLEYRPQAAPPAQALSALIALRERLDGPARRTLDAMTDWPLRIVGDEHQVSGVVLNRVPEGFYADVDLPSGKRARLVCEAQHLMVDAARSRRIGMPVPTLDQRIEICRELARALELLHRPQLQVSFGDINARTVLFRLAPTPTIMLVESFLARIDGEQVTVPQLSAPDWQPPEGSGLPGPFSDRYKLGLFVLRVLAPGPGASIRVDPAAAAGALDDEGVALLAAAVSDRPEARPSAADWLAYFDARVRPARPDGDWV